MVKGINKMSLTSATVQLAIEEYINSRLKPGVNVTVSHVWAEENNDLFSIWFKEKK